MKVNSICLYSPCIFSVVILLSSSNYFVFPKLELVFFFSKAKIAPLKKSQKITRRQNGREFHSEFIKQSFCKSKTLANYLSIFDFIGSNFSVCKF